MRNSTDSKVNSTTTPTTSFSTTTTTTTLEAKKNHKQLYVSRHIFEGDQIRLDFCVQMVAFVGYSNYGNEINV